MYSAFSISFAMYFSEIFYRTEGYIWGGGGNVRFPEMFLYPSNFKYENFALLKY